MARKIEPLSDGRKVLAQLGKLDRALSEAQGAAGSLITYQSAFPAAKKLADEIWNELEAMRKRVSKMHERRERPGGIGPGPF
jgi:hypothetical protein